jgi:hypothetical protein
MIRLKLPFSPRTAQRLMAIARHPILSNATHGSCLPPSYRTLYELTKIDHQTLREKLADGTINPKMVRSQVMELRGEVTGAIIEAVKRSKGGLTSDEVRAAINDRVPAATVRGIMSKLAKRGELTRTDDWREGRSGVRGQVYVVPADDADESPPAQNTLEQLRSDYLAAIGTLEHRAQRDEMRGLYRNFILSLPLDQQVEDLRELVKNDMAHWKVEQFSKMMEIMTLRFRR